MLVKRLRHYIKTKDLDWFGRAFVLSVLFAGGFIGGSLVVLVITLAFRGQVL